GLRDRRAARARTRAMRADAQRRAFTHQAGEQYHQLTALLVLVPDLGTPRAVGPVLEGQLAHGTPLTVFDFEEVTDDDRVVSRLGFVLDYPTDWPTFELAGAISRSPHEHE